MMARKIVARPIMPVRLITSKVIRHIVTVHGALAFFFNVAVLALTVNIISNLI